MAEPSLKTKTTQGLFWGGINNGAIQLLNLLFGIFLSRLLDASDYGMVGMLTIFSLIANSLQESGFILGLTNKKHITHQDYNAVFWFSCTVSFCLYGILFFCAPLIARFYHTPELTALARYSFLGIFFSSFGIVPTAILFKNLKVKQRTISSISALICSGLVGISLAYHGFSYWGIATQNLTYILVVTISNWIKSGWRPSLKINISPLKDIIGFSSKVLLTNIFTHINNNLFSVFLGRYYNETSVGNFNQANKWNTMGHSLISNMINGIAQPVLAQVSDETERQRRIFRKMLRFTAFVSFPAMFGLSLIAPELITIAITDKWKASASILRLLCIGGAFVPITVLYTNLLISKGKSNIYMWNTLCIGILQIGMMLCLFPYGIRTMIVVYLCINICWLFVWHYFVWKEIRLSLWDAFKDIFPYGAAAAGIMLILYYLTSPIQNIYILFFVKILAAIGLYLFTMKLSGSKTYTECKSYLLEKNKRKKKY